MALRPEQRCEAAINYQQVQKPVDRIVYNFEGRRIDLGPDVNEQPGIVEVAINCEACPFNQEVLDAEGAGPYGATNRARRKAKEFIEQNCQKFLAYQAEGRIVEATSDLNPNL